MTRPVVVLPEAEQDLAEAFTWYEEQRAGLGGAFLNEAASLFDRLGKFPLAFPVVEDPFRRGFLKRFPFAAYFLVDSAQTPTVYAVLHYRRDPGIWKERLSL